MPSRRNQIALLTANVPFDRDARIIVPAPRGSCRRDTLYGLRSADTLLDPLGEYPVHPRQLAARFGAAQPSLDCRKEIGLDHGEGLAGMAVIPGFAADWPRERHHGHAYDRRACRKDCFHKTGSPVPMIWEAQTKPISA